MFQVTKITGLTVTRKSFVIEQRPHRGLGRPTTSQPVIHLQTPSRRKGGVYFWSLPDPAPSSQINGVRTARSQGPVVGSETRSTVWVEVAHSEDPYSVEEAECHTINVDTGIRRTGRTYDVCRLPCSSFEATFFSFIRMW